MRNASGTAEESAAIPPICQEPTDNGNGSLHTSEEVQIHILENPDDLSEFLTRIHLREMTEASLHKLSGILKALSCPATLVSEERYVDPVYRDTYYRYFSEKYSPIRRDCVRLSFFQGTLCPEIFYSYDADSERFLQARFVGVCVLKPLRSGELGTTILNPGKLRLPSRSILTADYEFHILGHTLHAEGFPYSSQDTETMSCAEVSVWTILDYFGTRYRDYRTVLPGEILQELERRSSEQVLPTRGLEFSSISGLFKAFGFSPRLYDRRAFESNSEQQKLFQICFHSYIASGLPLAVGLSGERRGEQAKHCIACIGYGAPKTTAPSDILGYLGQNNAIPYIDSSSLFSEYVVMDDNRLPYRSVSFDRMPDWDASEVSTFAVPLRKGIFLDAGDAFAIAKTVFCNENLGFLHPFSRINEAVNQENPLTLRLFLASAASYRGFRAKHASSLAIAAFFGAMRLPEYVWVVEISTLRQFLNRRVLGEIVIDAKASRNSYLDSLVMIRYLDYLGFRAPEEEAVRAIDAGLKRRTLELNYPYAMYQNPLMRRVGDEDG